MSCWRHKFGRPHRVVEVDMQTCINCGHERVCPIQFGHRTYGISASPLLTAELEAEILHEQAEIRRREEFWR